MLGEKGFPAGTVYSVSSNYTNTQCVICCDHPLVGFEILIECLDENHPRLIKWKRI